MEDNKDVHRKLSDKSLRNWTLKSLYKKARLPFSLSLDVPVSWYCYTTENGSPGIICRILHSPPLVPRPSDGTLFLETDVRPRVECLPGINLSRVTNGEPTFCLLYPLLSPWVNKVFLKNFLKVPLDSLFIFKLPSTSSVPVWLPTTYDYCTKRNDYRIVRPRHPRLGLGLRLSFPWRPLLEGETPP